MAITNYNVLDGQIFYVYSTGNTYIGSISLDAVGQMILQGAGGNDIYFGDGSGINLVLDGGGSLIANGNPIDLGENGDIIRLDITGVTYLLDLSSNGKIVLPTFTSSPVGTKEGQLYYNSTDDNLYRYNGTTWLNAAGSSGTSGTSGSSGTRGTNGTSGSSGTRGTNGTNGTSGSSGTNGTSGSSGTNGTSGSSGTRGTNGTNGTSGSSGTNGTSGSSGTNGTSGSSGTRGTNGTNGTSGSSGTNGTSGAQGQNAGLRYNFSTTTTDADPGTGKFRYNSVAASATTQIFIDLLNTGSVDFTTYIDSWDDSTNTTNKGTLIVDSNLNSDTSITTFFVTSVTTATGYRKIVVTYVSGTLPSNGEECVIRFYRTGNAGTSGTNGTSGSSGTRGTNGTSGSSGTRGTNGTNGTSGSSGTNGTSGSSGTRGTNGTSGSSGTRGTNGTNGTSGSSGTNGTSGMYLRTVETKDTGYTITTSDHCKTFTCNSTSTQTFLLPSVVAGDIGFEVTIIKLGTGTVVIDAADSDTIEDSGAGDTIYCSEQYFATLTLKLATETKWIIKYANGIWITTD